MASATMTLISAQTLGGTTASATFSSIPATYNDLKLVMSTQIAGAFGGQDIRLTFNGDSATNYSDTNLYASGTSAGSSRDTSATYFLATAGTQGANNGANVFASSEIYIPNYTSTSSRSFLARDVSEINNTSVYLALVAGLYRGASAISSIALTNSNGGFITNSTFYLYGIKNS